MTRKSLWTGLLAVVVLAGVAGTYSRASGGQGMPGRIVVAAADDNDRDRPAEPPRRDDPGRDDRRRDVGERPKGDDRGPEDRPRDVGERPKRDDRGPEDRRRDVSERPMREGPGPEDRRRDDRPRDVGERPGRGERPDRGEMPERPGRGRMPEGRPEQPGMPPRPGVGPERPEHPARMMHMLDQLRGACFNPMDAGLLAVAGLKDDVPRKPEQVAGDLEAALARTKTLGLRNAIHLMLRDIYKAQGQSDRVMDHLNAMLAENDRFIQEHQPKPER